MHTYSISSPEEWISFLHMDNSKRTTVIGAGGKTTLLSLLSQGFSSCGQSTLLTTTTHIFPPSHLSEALLLTCGQKKSLEEAFRTRSLVALGKPESHTHKWGSFPLSFLEEIADVPDRIVCEGDGAKKNPLKIPRQGEPVFFPKTDTVVGIMGLSALYRPASEVLFGLSSASRTFPDLLPALDSSGGQITPDLLELIALSPCGLRKQVHKDQRFQILLNQADLLSPHSLSSVQLLCKKIRDKGVDCHIVSLQSGLLYE